MIVGTFHMGPISPLRQRCRASVWARYPNLLRLNEYDTGALLESMELDFGMDFADHFSPLASRLPVAGGEPCGPLLPLIVAFSDFLRCWLLGTGRIDCWIDSDVELLCEPIPDNLQHGGDGRVVCSAQSCGHVWDYCILIARTTQSRHYLLDFAQKRCEKKSYTPLGDLFDSWECIMVDPTNRWVHWGDDRYVKLQSEKHWTSFR